MKSFFAARNKKGHNNFVMPSLLKKLENIGLHFIPVVAGQTFAKRSATQTLTSFLKEVKKI